MAAIERTAYPRFRHEPNASELRDLFSPEPHKIDFARSLVRSNEHFFAAVLLLKCIQYLGYFPEFSEIPAAVVNHVRVCLRLSAQEMPAFGPMRTLQRYQTAIIARSKREGRQHRQAG